MPFLVLRVPEVEPPEERIESDLGGSGQIASAVRLGLREAQQLACAALGVLPHPPVQRQERSIERRSAQRPERLAHSAPVARGRSSREVD